MSPLHVCGLRKGSCLWVALNLPSLDLLRKGLQVCYLRTRRAIWTSAWSISGKILDVLVWWRRVAQDHMALLQQLTL